MNSQSPQEKFPLHWLVWNNEYENLNELLTTKQHDIESLDPRGRTPLHLAVSLGHIESVKVLLKNDANANAENSRYWTVTQEAVTTGDPEMLQICLQYRDYQRYTLRTEGIPALLNRLKEAPDFYVEMKWEFTSWVPLVARMCPSDTYKVWKSGANVRIDTTLLRFDNRSWLRGKRSYVFKGSENSAVVTEIDHDAKQVYSDVIELLPHVPSFNTFKPSEDAIAARLTAPIASTYIDTEKIEFERNKSGIYGWRSDRSEEINGHECKVFSATNVELVTKTRKEHLSDQDKQDTKKFMKNPLETFLGNVEEENANILGATCNGDVDILSTNPCCITPEDYFDPLVDLGTKDIGRPIEQSKRIQKLKAVLWLAEQYPLSLQEQVVPIIDLMAANNAHFRKLKDFITLQLPSGFPVKIEIPLFHVLNARITFGNIFGMDEAVESVQLIDTPTESKPQQVVIDETVFDAPPDYHSIGGADLHMDRLRDEDDELLQFAIQQSLVEAGTEDEQSAAKNPQNEVTFWEAINRPNQKPKSCKELQNEEERQLQKALEESMKMNHSSSLNFSSSNDNSFSDINEINDINDDINDDADLMRIMELSLNEQQEDERRRQQEDADLQRILELSLVEH